ncbi:SDR family NAD(P)-dependent oxidoreductase [Goodfellowiella coeruleoviolacea]|uniref:NAD(P)-dependent dehydrogenase, short-chain alcohol dehydrogenase family n=1 Tax=Goodfellowiella coeruleoviolacea TaxID=334858 RepID=A0AAE3G9T6_9PSEU|nr:SDR family oxidoreductase [Goodfellowiella coeruleoviolacea]MCP2163524.1 NAD(P)-dependent dehydrogenase, short-chain alcohol dehydrogenase family [Goodfellowiella coeruleoviolacea]
MQIDLSGRTALVTGSTAGIGYATAEALARAGAEVVVNGRDADRVAGAVDALREATGSPKLRGVAADVATAAGAASLVAEVPDVDVLVNNAGIFSATPVFEIPDAEWQRFFEVNVLSGVRLARHYTPRMVERGWGRVIFVSSESSVQTPTEMVHYGMTKTAQLAVSRGMAQAVAGSGVTVNSVLPGPTLTPGVEEFIASRVGAGISFEEAERRFIQEERPTSLLGRLIRPHEVANFITYLASEHSSATTGGALRVDGGVATSIIP